MQVIITDTSAPEVPNTFRHEAYLAQEIVELSSSRCPREVGSRLRIRLALCVVMYLYFMLLVPWSPSPLIIVVPGQHGVIFLGSIQSR